MSKMTPRAFFDLPLSLLSYRQTAITIKKEIIQIFLHQTLGLEVVSISMAINLFENGLK